MKKLACQLLGHDWNAEAMDHNYYECDRCQYASHEPPEKRTVADWFWILKHRALRQFDRLRCWAKPCSECGKRFHRHDESVDHLPF